MIKEGQSKFNCRIDLLQWTTAFLFRVFLRAMMDYGISIHNEGAC